MNVYIFRTATYLYGLRIRWRQVRFTYAVLCWFILLSNFISFKLQLNLFKPTVK